MFMESWQYSVENNSMYSTLVPIFCYSNCFSIFLFSKKCIPDENIVIDEGFSNLSHVLSDFESSSANFEELVLMTQMLVTRGEREKSSLLCSIAAAECYIQLFVNLAKVPPVRRNNI